MAEVIAIKEIQKLAEVMQGFKDNRALLVSFLPPLTAMTQMLQGFYKELVDSNAGFNSVEIEQFEMIAKMFHILSFDCSHNNPTIETLALAQVCSEVENICLSAVQYSKGLLDSSAGYFYASEQNLAALTQASLDVLEATNTKDHTKTPIKFIQFA